jgi:hypothetical protein
LLWHEVSEVSGIGVADHLWLIAELIEGAEAASADEPTAPASPPPPAPLRPRFTVIHGDKTWVRLGALYFLNS